MDEPGLALDLAERLRTHLRARLPALRFAYVFGSMARGDAHGASDLDLAVWTPVPLSAERRFDVQESLARIVGRDVDLIDLHTASTVLRVRVIDEGVLLIDDVPGERQHFEVRCLSEYAHLNEARAGILQDVRDRGSVYGTRPVA